MGNTPPDPRTVSKAISLYLGIAYPDGVPKRIAALVDDLITSSGDFYANPAFIKQDNGGAPSYTLRLGCAHYPHMKFLVATWAGGSHYFFRVDAHDKHVSVPAGHPEFNALAALRQKNQAVVEAVEAAWTDSGLPTYASCFSEGLAELEPSIGGS